MLRPLNPPNGRVVPPAALAVLLFLAAVSGTAYGYIDPGTGGPIFSALPQILLMVGLAAVGALAFGRRYVGLAAFLLWRHRLWLLAIVAAAMAVLVLFFLSGGGIQAVLRSVL